MSSSKIYLNPSTFFHTHVHHTNPSSCHLLPEWLISLTRFPASILASTTIRYHTVARVTEHIIPLFRCLKPSNDFLLLSEKKMKSHYSCLPLRSHLIPLSCHSLSSRHTGSFSSSKIPSYFSLVGFTLVISFAWNVFMQQFFLSLKSHFFSEIPFLVHLLNNPFTSFITPLILWKYLEH